MVKKMPEMNCDCDDWRNNICIIDRMIDIAIRFGNYPEGYDGKQLVYCPWCSKALKRNQQEENDE